LVSIGKEDYTTMAKAMSTMGATSADVDVDALASDIRELFRQFNRLEVDALVSASPESNISTLEEDSSGWCHVH